MSDWAHNIEGWWVKTNRGTMNNKRIRRYIKKEKISNT